MRDSKYIEERNSQLPAEASMAIRSCAQQLLSIGLLASNVALNSA